MQIRGWPFIFICCIFLFVKAAFAADEERLTDLVITPPSKNSPHTKITITFDKPSQYKVFTLSNPRRLVIDLHNTQYDFLKGKSVDFTGTEITDYRHGIQDGYNLRLVFDLNSAVHFNVETQHTQKFQLMLTLTAASESLPLPTPSPVKDETSQKTKIVETKSTKPVSTSATHAIIEEDLKSMPAKDTASKPEVSTSKNLPSSPPVSTVIKSVGIVMPPKKHTFVVVIDAGHGGKDPGAHGPNGTDEKNVTIAIARDLQNLVNDEPGMKAVMTRKGDYYVGLRNRLKLARKGKGDIFIAIHADAYNDPTASGASVYALSLHGASSEAALWVAQKENYSELGGIDLNDMQGVDAQIRSVLIDLSQTATIGASLQLGQSIIRQLGDITDLHHGVVEQAPFMVLKSPDIPSILVETGFISNPKEESRLKTDSYQEKIAKALMDGINAYYRKNVQQSFTQAVISK